MMHDSRIETNNYTARGGTVKAARGSSASLFLKTDFVPSSFDLGHVLVYFLIVLL